MFHVKQDITKAHQFNECNEGVAIVEINSKEQRKKAVSRETAFKYYLI